MRRGTAHVRLRSTLLGPPAVTGAAVLASAPAGAAPTVTRTFSSGNIDKSIPNSSSNPSRINVPVRGHLKDVDLMIRLTHPDLTDLYSIQLDNPTRQGFGRSTDMASGGYLEGANLGTGPGNCSDTLTRFDDEAATHVMDADAPYAGAVRPDATLDPFDGYKMNGRWVLDLANQGATGVLHCWKLRVKYRPL